ncbi:MAG: GGDEF domain-containing protein [Burkholderiales bacterium]|nr:GGDEF domain-containing protein [Burkholderiales bacterium]
MAAAPVLTRKPSEASKQALRMRRFAMAVATYAGCGLFAQICAWLGFLPPWLPTWWCVGAAVVNTLFYLAIRSGYNLRLRDPSMTELQLVASMVAVMVLVYHADAARGALLMLFPVPLLFGVLRLRLLQMLRVGLVAVAGYAVVIVVLLVREPQRIELNLELVNLLSLSAVMVFVALMCAYISRVRVELSRSLAKIEDMAQMDALTGVFNRRHLDATLLLELQRWGRRSRSGLVLCMVDVDHFKQINDTYGHAVGDDVLVAVAQALGTSIRANDYLARFGGEEFVILLDMSSAEDWLTVCERARRQIEVLQIAAIDNTPVRISMGVALCAHGDTAATLLERADKALYRAKAEGRNCIRVAPESTAITAS